MTARDLAATEPIYADPYTRIAWLQERVAALEQQTADAQAARDEALTKLREEIPWTEDGAFEAMQKEFEWVKAVNKELVPYQARAVRAEEALRLALPVMGDALAVLDKHTSSEVMLETRRRLIEEIQDFDAAVSALAAAGADTP